MVRKNLVFLFCIVFFILVSSFIASASCTCLSFCDEDRFCYLGECTPADLLLCGGESTLSCPFPSDCPACQIQYSDCIDENNSFIADGSCDDYFQEILGNSGDSCKQTISGEIFTSGNAALSNVQLSVISDIDGVNFKNYFEDKLLLNNFLYYFEIPRCNLNLERVTIVASKDKYDPAVEIVNVEVDSLNSGLTQDFILPQGMCRADCTDSFNRCNPECDGFIDLAGDDCSFFFSAIYPKSMILDKCAYKMKGTDIILNMTDINYTIVDCCEGDLGVRVVPRPKSDIKLSDDRDLVAIEKPVKYGNDLVTLKVYVWDVN